jgi:hypothetical protein
MRLGQLARKITIRQSDMVDFLVKSGVSIANDSNARLEDDHVQRIMQHFAPSFLEKELIAAEPIASEATIEQPAAAVVIEHEAKAEQIEIPVPQPAITEPKLQIEENIEVIKAPKVDLPGLKVLGKIELPEPKKKEVPVEETENVAVPVSNIDTNPKPSAAPRSRGGQGDRLDKRRERPNRSSANPIALQREREARAAEEKRRADAIKEKEKRTEYYLNRVKTNAPTKAARIFSEPVEEFTKTSEKEPPKTWLGKFFRWLTTA